MRNVSDLGRTPAPAELAELLGSGRPMTLTGPPGVGKSYLAAQVARTTRLPVRRADLSVCRDPAQVPRAVADALRIDTGPGPDPLPGLLRALAPQRGLLVLDTCEHVPAGCAELVARLRDACPGIQLLATSRRPLDTADELLVGVRPMTPERTEELLLEQTAAHGMQLDKPWAHLLARHIDGDPLSVVLIARALRETGPRRLFGHLTTSGGRFTVLTDGPAEPARHRTLWQAIEWSHELCGRGERLMWACLSAFSGSFTRDQVELLFDVHGELDLLARSSIVLSDATDRFCLPLSHREYGRQQMRILSGLYDPDGD
ncbi:hypothetical protein G6045_24440 [Streptomyces sp. YC504]|uniref:AAA+ ATPase domain-containing protein n=1 Tax=Streptomyces mesophilus TaxID=1775132 RepID=A0A6G4XQ97_9ACTN|nr:AAA family ATPase [Streptomyces mesophilus]NGO78781.1 hypothetical protein [Streptomyces mesophilus]